MTVNVHFDPSSQRTHVELEGEPSWCQALAMAPPRPEPELAQGRWLVLLFAVWSGPDRQAIRRAIEAVRPFEGGVRLGIRPFDDADEHVLWCPELAGVYGSPVWLLLRDGELSARRTGSLGEAALREWLDTWIATP